VTIGGGQAPPWAPNGRELFYLDDEGYLNAVPVDTRTGFSFGNPTRLLQTRYFGGATRSYDVSRDGQKFLMIKSEPGASPPPPSIVVVSNWVEELKAVVRRK
jgi:hypothetical protein